jgi:hypothetical protein
MRSKIAGLVLALSSITAWAASPSRLGDFIAEAYAAPTTSIQTEYLMTLRGSLEPAQVIDSSRVAVNVPGGVVEGPRLKGKILPPAGDWGYILPSGVFRLDVSATIQTDDGEIIYVSYNGIWQRSKEVNDKFNNGETITSTDCYFFSAPTFQTKSEKYGWLNGVQAIGKMVEIKRGDHITYDIFVVK